MKLSLVSDSLSHLSFDALLEFRKIGEGILADQSWPMAKALKEDGYDSVIRMKACTVRKAARSRTASTLQSAASRRSWGATRFAARESRFSHWLAATP